MSMPAFAYAKATTLSEAIEVLGDDCRPLAGGTDLVGLMKEGLAAPARLVNVKAIVGLNELGVQEDGLHVGAAVTLARLLAAPALSTQPALAGLYAALLQTAAPQLRHMATLGGNLVQAPRCWYYRNPQVPCWRKGGTSCFAFRGENKRHVLFAGGPCYAVHPSDPAVALCALEAQVQLVGPQGARTVPLEAFYRQPDRVSRQDSVLATRELISGLIIPAPQVGSRGTYVKAADRATWDFALASAAVQLTLQDGVVSRARIVLGGVAFKPWRAAEAEGALTGQPLSAATIEASAQAAVAGATPLAHNAYKVDLVQGVVREALYKLSEGGALWRSNASSSA